MDDQSEKKPPKNTRKSMFVPPGAPVEESSPADPTTPGVPPQPNNDSLPNPPPTPAENIGSLDINSPQTGQTNTVNLVSDDQRELKAKKTLLKLIEKRRAKAAATANKDGTSTEKGQPTPASVPAPATIQAAEESSVPPLSPLAIQGEIPLSSKLPETNEAIEADRKDNVKGTKRKSGEGEKKEPTTKEKKYDDENDFLDAENADAPLFPWSFSAKKDNDKQQTSKKDDNTENNAPKRKSDDTKRTSITAEKKLAPPEKTEDRVLATAPPQETKEEFLGPPLFPPSKDGNKPSTKPPVKGAVAPESPRKSLYKDTIRKSVVQQKSTKPTPTTADSQKNEDFLGPPLFPPPNEDNKKQVFPDKDEKSDKTTKSILKDAKKPGIGEPPLQETATLPPSAKEDFLGPSLFPPRPPPEANKKQGLSAPQTEHPYDTPSIAQFRKSIPPDTLKTIRLQRPKPTKPIGETPDRPIAPKVIVLKSKPPADEPKRLSDSDEDPEYQYVLHKKSMLKDPPGDKTIDKKLTEVLNKQRDYVSRKLKRDKKAKGPMYRFPEMVEALTGQGIPCPINEDFARLQSQHSRWDPQGSVIEYFSPVLKTFVPINMRGRYRGCSTDETCVKGINISKIPPKKDALEGFVDRGRHENIQKIFDEMSKIAIDEPHLDYLVELQSYHAETMPIPIFYDMLHLGMEVANEHLRILVQEDGYPPNDPIFMSSLNHAEQLRRKLQMYGALGLETLESERKGLGEYKPQWLKTRDEIVRDIMNAKSRRRYANLRKMEEEAAAQAELRRQEETVVDIDISLIPAEDDGGGESVAVSERKLASLVTFAPIESLLRRTSNRVAPEETPRQTPPPPRKKKDKKKTKKKKKIQKKKPVGITRSQEKDKKIQTSKGKANAAVKKALEDESSSSSNSSISYFSGSGSDDDYGSGD